jgi:hypothetical protein
MKTFSLEHKDQTFFGFMHASLSKGNLQYFPFLLSNGCKHPELLTIGNNPLRVDNSDVYNPLKAITVLLYRTTDQGLDI